MTVWEIAQAARKLAAAGETRALEELCKELIDLCGEDEANRLMEEAFCIKHPH